MESGEQHSQPGGRQSQKEVAAEDERVAARSSGVSSTPPSGWWGGSGAPDALAQAARAQDSVRSAAEAAVDLERVDLERPIAGIETDQSRKKGRVAFHIEDSADLRDQGMIQRSRKRTSQSSKDGSHLLKGDSQGGTFGRVARLSDEELKILGEKHLRQTAVTVMDEQTGNYEYLDIWDAQGVPLDFLGVGIQLHFRLLEQLKKVLWIMLILALPSLFWNAMGGMVPTMGVAWFSIGNLGYCTGAGCQSVDDLYNRTVFNPVRCAELCGAVQCELVNAAWICDVQVRDVAFYYGLLDSIGILVFVIWVWYFRRWVIPEVSAEVETILVTPKNYSVYVVGMPEFLPEGNADYGSELHEHFVKVLRELDEGAVRDEGAVHDVVTIHNYKGAIGYYTEKGNLLIERRNHEVQALKAQERQDDPEAVRQHELIAAIDARVTGIDNKLKDQLLKTDDQRPVLMAFVTLTKEEYKEKLLAEYRFSLNGMTRCCQRRRLRFQGKALKVDQAPDPSDLFWENLDFPKVWRNRRQLLLGFLTLLVLGLCGAALAELKGRALANPAPQTHTWVLKAPEGSPACLSLCNWQLYADPRCSQLASRSEQWNVTQLFTVSGSTTGVDRDALWSSQTCSDPVESARCQNHNSPQGADWVGIEFERPRRVLCMKVSQRPSAQAEQFRVFSCGRTPSAEEMEQWEPELNCQEMKSIEPGAWIAPPWTVDGNITLSEPLAVEANDTCDIFGNISFEAANASRSALGDGDAASQVNGLHNCYCQQVSFRSPRLLITDAAINALCWDVVTNALTGLSATGGIVLAGVVVNQILLRLYTSFVYYEHHLSVTERMNSQLTKLFLAQFFNTGLLYLFVSINIENVVGFLGLVLPGLFHGEYSDFSANWYASEGSTIFLVIVTQVFTSALLPAVMGATVQPLSRHFARRGKATVETINELYTHPQWDIAMRTAQRLNIIFCVLLFSACMPILYLVGIMYCWLAHWGDRISLLRYSQRPPLYNERIMRLSCNRFLPLAALLHLCLAMWTYGSQVILPSEWSDFYLRDIWETLIIRVPSDYYSSVMAEYSPGGTQGITSDYFWARLLDSARIGPYCVTAVFLCFCGYYLFHVLLFSPLRSIIRPIMTLLTDWLTEGAKRAHLEKLSARLVEAGEQGRKDLSYREAEKDMKLKGLTTTYHIEHNMAYQAAYKALKYTTAKAALIHRVEEEGLESVIESATETQKELKATKKQLQEVERQLQAYQGLCPTLEDLEALQRAPAELEERRSEFNAQQSWRTPAAL